MAITSSKRDSWRREPRDNDCKENDTATQKSINRLRRKYCDKLYDTAGQTSKWEKSSEGHLNLYEQKKCMFLWTELNYRRYRNTEISIGTELMQSSLHLKENVTGYIKMGTDLSTSLKNISRAVKDIKTKMNDLRESAGKLENCKNDSSNCTQIMVLTGETQVAKKDRPKECENADNLLCDLICMPKALGFDIDSIYKSSSEVIGIQVFSNINALDPLQNTLSGFAKAFESHLQVTLKTRENDMKKMQEDLIKCLQETTKATVGLYNNRSDFEGIMETLNFVCCPECGCVHSGKPCDPRLQDCEREICDICDEIKKTFCTTEEPEPQKAAH